MRLGAVLGAVLWVGMTAAGAVPAGPTASVPIGPTALFHLSDPRLDEISGIAAGIVSPGVVYVQNDSGDSARFFALDKRTGAVLATYHVPGATNLDWEDIAVAPDARGTPSVWLADIGDNDAVRAHIEIYRVDEPRVDTHRVDLDQSTTAPQVWTLRYPDGAHDAESLAVSATGIPYVITKSILGKSAVYAAPAAPGSATLRPIGPITFGFTGTPGPYGPVGELTATGADFSRDDPARLVVRTYTDAYVWTIDRGDVSAALRKPAQRIALPQQPQGEGICFDGSRLLVDSEKVGSAVYAVPIPPSLDGSSATSPSTTRSSGTGSATASSTAVPDAGASSTGWWWAGAGVVVVLAVVASLLLTRRRGFGGRGSRR